MVKFSSFSLREIGGNDRLEEFAVHETIETASGKHLEVVMVCGGVGGGQAGEQAARLAARTVVDSLTITEAQDVPVMLVTAVEEANRVVYSEMRGAGSSTLALVAVDVNAGEYGRAYLAHVGNSRVYLVRRRGIVRLDIDHTLGNEYIYNEQMSAADVKRLENADYLTRIVGINPEIQVDIGFYAERGKSFVNARRAFEIGKRGLLLKEGDTFYVGTQGLFESAKDANRSPLLLENLVDFAMDDSAQHAVRALLDIATRRNPRGNVTLAMLCAPSRFRRTSRVGTRLGRRGRVLVVLITMMLVISGGVWLANVLQQEQQNREVRQTQQAFQEIIARASWTPTFTRTPPPTPTNEPTATPTVRPTVISENQVGVQYFPLESNTDAQPIFRERRVSSDEIVSFLVISGGNTDTLDSSFEPATVFLQNNNSVELQLVTNTSGAEFLTLDTLPEANVFIQTGNFSNGGVRVGMEFYRDISLFSQSACLAARQIPPDPGDPNDTEKVAFTCFGDGDDADATCSYSLRGGQVFPIEMGERVLIDLDESELLLSEFANYQEVKTYRDLVFQLTQSEQEMACLAPYLDADADSVPYPNDQCELEPGSVTTNGCPDEDMDQVPDRRDECPDQVGPGDNRGCPLPTATPLNLDPDNDGILPPADACPIQFGLEENNGCPVAVG